MDDATPDCREILKRLYLYLDGEIAGEDCAAIQAHVERCRGCGDHAEFERAVKDVVRRKCQEGTAPPQLVVRLRALLRRAD